MAFVLVVAGLALGALETGALALCSTAQGAEFIFRVAGGAELKAGESRELLKSADGIGYTFKKIGGTPNVEYACSGMELSEKSTIFGGKPGTLSVKLKWTGCTGTVGSNSCTGVSAETPVRLKGEIVELIGSGGPAMRFSPETGEELIHFSATCGGKADARAVEGDFIVEPSPPCVTTKEVDFLFIGFLGEVHTVGGNVKTPTTMEGFNFSIEGSTFFHLPFFKWSVC
jgi:hypothetical protein